MNLLPEYIQYQTMACINVTKLLYLHQIPSAILFGSFSLFLQWLLKWIMILFLWSANIFTSQPTSFGFLFIFITVSRSMVLYWFLPYHANMDLSSVSLLLGCKGSLPFLAINKGIPWIPFIFFFWPPLYLKEKKSKSIKFL